MTREERRPYDDRQRAERGIYKPRMAGNTGSWKRPGRVFLYRFQRECDPADIWNSDFPPPELGKNAFLLF